MTKVVVVGSGPAGRMVVLALRKADKDVDITLVSAATTSELSWYVCGFMTNKKPYEGMATSERMKEPTDIVYGVATGVADGKVEVKSMEGESKVIDFDYIVCATGMKMPVFTPEPGQDSDERKTELTKLAKILADPDKHIVVAGGGAVGVEIAGDIQDSREQKGGNLTLLTPADRLLTDQSEVTSTKVLKQLQSMSVDVIFGERATSPTDLAIAEEGSKTVTVQLKSGKTIECDVYLPAYTRGPRTEWLTGAVGGESLPAVLDDKNRIHVDEFLAATAYPKLFAIGATSNIAEPALSMNMQSQAAAIAKNILKPNSAKYAGGIATAPTVQLVGSQTHGIFLMENTKMPSFCSTLMCHWCGFPCNLLCPCFLCALVCGPADIMACGWCCGPPEGKGVTKVFENASKMGLAADMAGMEGMEKYKPHQNETMNRY